MDGITIGNRVSTKKPHICGNSEWVVFQVADRIGIRCAKCGQKVFIVGHKFLGYINETESL